MATPVIMPRQGQSVETCILAEWHRKKGDTVNKGEIILSYETDKAAFDLESPASGTILDIFYQNGDEVRVLSNIAVIGQPGESVDEFKPDVVSSQGIVPEKLIEPEIDEEIIPYVAQTDEIRISPRARKLAEQLHVPIHRVRGTGPGGRIIERDIETAAATIRTTALAYEVIEKENKTIGTVPTGPGGLFRTNDLILKADDTGKGYVVKKISNVRRIIAEKNVSVSEQFSSIDSSYKRRCQKNSQV